MDYKVTKRSHVKTGRVHCCMGCGCWIQKEEKAFKLDWKSDEECVSNYFCAACEDNAMYNSYHAKSPYDSCFDTVSYEEA